MSDPLLTDDELTDLLLAPKRSKSGDKEVEAHAVKDLIAAVEFAENRNRPRRLFSTRTLSPPGTQ
jgi:hypothetical protein